MTEYIDKAELMSLIESEAHRWGDDYDWWQCLADIEDFPAFPAADIRIVVRGEWLRTKQEAIYQLPNFYYVYKCSVCGYRTHNELSNFCPNCGADMKNEDKEDK